MGESYATLMVQPIDLVRAFKLDFCLASVIKWLTKWHMTNSTECLQRADYYIALCNESPVSNELFFAIRMFCIVNGFMNNNSCSCLLTTVMWEIKNGRLDDAKKRLVFALANGK